MANAYKNSIPIRFNETSSSIRFFHRQSLKIKEINGISIICDSDYFPDISLGQYFNIYLTVYPSTYIALFSTHPSKIRPFLLKGIEYFNRLDEILASKINGRNGRYIQESSIDTGGLFLDIQSVGLVPDFTFYIHQFDDILFGY